MRRGEEEQKFRLRQYYQLSFRSCILVMHVTKRKERTGQRYARECYCDRPSASAGHEAPPTERACEHATSMTRLNLGAHAFLIFCSHSRFFLPCSSSSLNTPELDDASWSMLAGSQPSRPAPLCPTQCEKRHSLSANSTHNESSRPKILPSTHVHPHVSREEERKGNHPT